VFVIYIIIIFDIILNVVQLHWLM